MDEESSEGEATKNITTYHTTGPVVFLSLNLLGTYKKLSLSLNLEAQPRWSKVPGDSFSFVMGPGKCYP